jgi:hypothetical protein
VWSQLSHPIDADDDQPASRPTGWISVGIRSGQKSGLDFRRALYSGVISSGELSMVCGKDVRCAMCNSLFFRVGCSFFSRCPPPSRFAHFILSGVLVLVQRRCGIAGHLSDAALRFPRSNLRLLLVVSIAVPSARFGTEELSNLG